MPMTRRSDFAQGGEGQAGGSARRPAATQSVGGTDDVATAPPPSPVVEGRGEEPTAPAEPETGTLPVSEGVVNAVPATELTAVDTVEDPQEGDEPPPKATLVETNRPDGVSQPVDIRARLADRVRQIDFDEIALIELIDFLVELTRVPITFDLDSAERVGVHAMDRVSIHERETTVAQLLANALTRLGLTYSHDDGQIVVAAPETGSRVVRYRVDDLLEKGPVADSATPPGAFAERLRQLVAPTTWASAGGSGTIALRNAWLQVDQSPDVHYQILTFCEKLRMARRMPRRSRLPAQRFSLVSRRTSIQEELEQPITFTYVEPVSVVRLVRYLRQATGIAIVIDWRLLTAQGLTPDARLSCSVVDKPLGDALSAVLGPIGLAWRATSSRSIQIVTARQAEQRLEIEFYPVAGTENASFQPTRLLDEIRGSVAVGSWTDGGGAGLVVYDQEASQLIVLQTQAVQSQVEHWLNRRLAARTAP
jgi:hypothetical protein